MAKAPIRIGVVGCGSISVRGILPHLAVPDVQDRVRIEAVCDPVAGRAEAAAERFGAERAFLDIDDLLAHGNVDAVSIATPIGLHYEHGKKALAAGKHIHFNKTMTTTVAEATDLIETARRKGLKIVASPGQVLRPNVRRIKELVADGTLGTLCWAAVGSTFGTYHEDESVRQGSDVLSNIDPSWYYRKPGGGPLYDMTVYGLHTLTTILGPAKRVTSFSGTRLKEREFRGQMVPCDADDNTLMILDYGDSLFALVYGVASGRMPVRLGEGSFFGTKGTIIGSEMNGEAIDYPGRAELAAFPQANPTWLLPHVVGDHRGMQEAHVFEDVMQLVDWVRDDVPTPVTAEQARHVVDIIESAYRSSETGQAQILTTTF
ncbi:MAG: Gfo/Idh/MocA family oxidoreductase [Chloroflexota bacterium]|nr:MAG: Gfo/Idh/MocA family oxidoreductase [Chloroflexota bacterium]